MSYHTISRLLLRPKPRESAFLSTAAASGGFLTTVFLIRHRQTKASLQKQQEQQSELRFQIETDLMERIAQKPYLTNTQHIPTRLRVLAIDVPQMRQAFDGDCRINLSKIYADDVAPSKTVKVSEGRELEVIQKSLTKSLIKCRKNKKIGVELLEASVADLNPNNMRKAHSFGNLLEFDPGKYAAVRPDQGQAGDRTEQEDSEASSELANQGVVESVSRYSKTTRKDTEQGTVLATEEDEVDAPWNQYGWIEELQLRVQGRVAFGAILSPASALQRLLYGQTYRTTVPSNRSWWEWFLPPILHRDPAGMEGNKKTWASQRPHAVIADGAAMQRVPGSLRFLQRTCQESHVPLFIVNDPRVWGGNTHQDLENALSDMRKTIKYNIVQQSMRGSAFARGRLLGQLETEVKWQAKDMGRRTRQVVKDANYRLQQERDNDWSQLVAEALKQKLIYHKVIQEPSKKEGHTNYSDGMIELSRQCLEDCEEVEGVNSRQKTTDDKVSKSYSQSTNTAAAGV